MSRRVNTLLVVCLFWTASGMYPARVVAQGIEIEVDAPEDKPAEAADPEKVKEAVRKGGLQGLLRGILQPLILPQMGPRVRAAEGPAAERAQGARDAIDARAPRDPKLEGLWKAALGSIQQKDWKRAIERLQRLLDSPEDAVYRTGGGRWESLRTAASRRLGTVPADVLNDYEGQYGGLAQQLWLEARRTGRLELVVEVATRFFHTRAGRDAAEWLAREHFDRSEFALAVRWFEELEAVGAPITSDPLWRLQAAAAARQASPELVKKFLEPVLSAEATRPLQLGGERIAVQEWWDRTAARQPQRTPVLNQWPQLFGTAARVGVAAGERPLLKPEWSTPLTFNTAVQRQLERLLQDLEDDGSVPVLTSVPLVLGQKIVMRDLRGVRVVEASSGKTLWSTPEGLSPERVLSGLPISGQEFMQVQRRFRMRNFQNEYNGQGAEYHPLVSWLCRDATSGLISSDGHSLFVLDDVAVMTRNQMGYQGGDDDVDTIDPLGAVWNSNRLTSYDLETGRAQWSVGGPAETAGPLAGCFFLGAPSFDGNELFIVGSLGEEVRLFVLDPATGRPRWSQLLAYSDTKIESDIARRWVSTPIAVGQGIVVCPTTVGWLVAVDRVRRTVLWAHRYLPEEEGEHRGFGDNPGTEFLPQTELGGQWLATPPVIADGLVVFAAPDGDNLACVDLVQGKLQWQEDRDDGLYLAGVANDRVIIVGPSRVTARSLRDGKLDWYYDWNETEKKLSDVSFGAQPSGRGIVVGPDFYLPLADGSLHVIRLSDGERVARLSVWPGQPPLGNLVKAGRWLLSFGPRGCQLFDEQPGVLREIAERKAKNPGDAIALIREAELWLLTPDYAAAAAQLRSVVTTDLSSEWQQRHRTAWWQALIGELQSEQGNANEALDSLQKLARTPEELLTVELYRIERSVQAGETVAAFEAFWKLAEQDDAPAVIVRPHQPQLQVQRRIWLKGRMRSLWEAADPKSRSALDTRITTAIQEALKGSMDRWSRLSEWSDYHPAAVRLHWALADEYAATREFSRAEARLLPWIDHPEPAVAAETLVRLAALSRQFGLIADAQLMERRLAAEYAKLPLSTGGTVTDWLEQRPADALQVVAAPPVAAMRWDDWPLETQQIGSQYAPPVQSIELPAQSPSLAVYAMQVEQNEQRLTMASRLDGSWRWLAPLRWSPRSNDHGYSPSQFLGRSLVLLNRDVVHLLSPVDRRVIWSKTLEPTGDWANEHHHLGRGQVNPLTSTGDDGDEPGWSLAHAGGGGRLVAVQPGYFCVLGRRSLSVLDPRTGRELWTRTGLGQMSRIIGTRDFVCVLDYEDDEATAYRAADGQPVEIPGLVQRLKQAVEVDGNEVVVQERSKGMRLFGISSAKVSLRRVELLTGKERWRQDFIANSLVGPLDDQTAIAVEPSPTGKAGLRTISLINLREGTRQTLAPVTLGVTDAGVYALADAERVYLISNKGDGQHHYGDSLPSINVHGTVFAWEKGSGRALWKKDVSEQNLILDRFQANNVLLFMTRTWKQQGNASYTLLNLLAINKRTGKTLHESSTPSMFGGFHSVALREAEGIIELASYNLRLRLTPQRESTPKDPPPAQPTSDK